MKPTLLVIEDDHDTRVAIRTSFENEGYQVLSATEGNEGLRLMRTAQPRPCAVLLDMMLPIMGGEDFLKAKSKDAKAAKIPVVVFTAQKPPVPQDPQIVATFKKPVDIDELIAVVNQHCKKTKNP